jgi:hypothetical protein
METRRFQNEREVVTSCATRIEAMEAVQLLADRKVDANCVTVTRHTVSVGDELAAARRLQRALLGALLGAALGTAAAIALGSAWPVWVAVALGAAAGAATRRSSPVRHTGATPRRIQIERHDVVTDPDQATEARDILEEAGFRAK